MRKDNETALPEKEKKITNQNMEDNTDANYMHVERVCKEFKKKDLDEYHDLYLTSVT